MLKENLYFRAYIGYKISILFIFKNPTYTFTILFLLDYVNLLLTILGYHLG